jgi:hypothetical protein
MNRPPRVLCVGVYLADRLHTAHHISDILSRSESVVIDQRWTALAPDGGKADVPDTVASYRERAPKCVLLNRMLSGFEHYDWVMLCDDDVEMAAGFADSLIAVAEHADLALVQPARTIDSYIDHPLVAQFPGLLGRRTRFVEIGPVVCMRADAAKLLLPFAPECKMGWGLDFVWPARVEAAGLRMGIVDAAPVAHRIRPPATEYDYAAANAEQGRLIAAEPSLTMREAFQVLEVFA